MRDIERWLGRLVAGLSALLLLVLISVKPWARTGATAANADDLRPVLIQLLTTVYAAFGQADEFAIYDGIAEAVVQDLVTPLYLQRRAAQLMEEESGAATEILDLELMEMVPKGQSDAGTVVAARWRVSGQVGHEDHSHVRVNEYAASLTIGRRGGGWKLTGFDLDTVARTEEEPIFFEGIDLFGGGQ